MTSPVLATALCAALLATDPGPAPAGAAAPLAVLPPAAAAGASDAAPEPSTVVIHDLSDLSYDDRPTRYRMTARPFVAFDGDARADQVSFDVGELVESLMYDCVAPDVFEYEGHGLFRLDDGRLMVVAPPALQEAVADLVATLRAAFTRTARVAVDVYAVRDPRALPDDLDAATLGDAEAAGALRLVHRRVDQVRMAVTERFEDVVSTTFVQEWDGLIAQGATAARPDLAELETGLRLLLRVEDVPGAPGVRLRHAVSVAELRDLGIRTGAVRQSIALDNTIDTRVVEVTQDLPVVAGATLVGSAVLPVGGATVLVARTDTHAGASAWVVRLAVVEVDPAPEPFTVGESTVAILDTSAARWSGYSPRELTARRLNGRSDVSGGFYGLRESVVALGQSVFPAPDTQDWEDVFRECEARLASADGTIDPWSDRPTWTDDGPWAVLGDAQGHMDQRLDAWRQVAGRRSGLVVELGVDTRTGGDRPPVTRTHARLGVESGWTGQVVVGDTVWLPRATEVDVATSASQSAPRIIDAFDGLSVIARAAGDGASVEFEIAQAALRALDGLHLGSTIGTGFDRPTWRLSDARVRVPADGRRRVVAEQVGGREGESGRTLWVAVRPR